MSSIAMSFWGSSTNKSNSKALTAAQTPGLKNLGNTCFLNAVLQSLASLGAMHAYLKKHFRLEEMPLTKSLQQTLRDLCVAGPAFEPQVSQNPELKRKFLTREQQDAHELMQFVLSMLDDEAERTTNRISSFSLVHDPIWNIIGRNLLVTEETKSLTSNDYGKSNPFCGLMKSTLSVDCMKCGAVCSPCLQKFSTVSLTIPLGRQEWSLEESLEDFTMEEKVTGVECPDCYTKRTLASKTQNQVQNQKFSSMDKRINKYTARKRLTFTRTPKALCLHLRRLVRSASGEPVKSNCHVNFPLKLDLSPYCSFGCGPEPPSVFKRREKKAPGVTTKDIELDDAINVFLKRRPFGKISLPAQVSGLSLSGGSNSSQAEADLYMAKKKEMTLEKPKQTTTGLSTLYHLVSVIVHHGSHLGGHYAVYRKLLTNPLRDASQYGEIGKLEGREEEERDWVYISDERVQLCSVAEVLKSQAYMLFYEKY